MATTAQKLLFFRKYGDFKIFEENKGFYAVIHK